MSGQTNFPWDKVIAGLTEKAKAFFVKNRRVCIIVFLIACLFSFAIITYSVTPKTPEQVPAPEKYSNLYLQDFIAGYRDYQQDFDVEDIYFGENFLNFTVNIKFRSKNVLMVKKLGVDMVLGLLEEYPELESISVKMIRDTGSGPTAVYGKAMYAGDENEVSWTYKE